MAAKKYTKETILKDDRFSKYQQDFLRVILTKDYYTIAEAKKIAEASDRAYISALSQQVSRGLQLASVVLLRSASLFLGALKQP